MIKSIIKHFSLLLMIAPTVGATDGNIKLRGQLNNSHNQFIINKTGKVAFMGGSITQMNGYRPMVSKFLENKLLDIMQFIIAPTIIGSGINSINIKPITNLKKVIRTKNKIYKFGEEMIVSLEF